MPTAPRQYRPIPRKQQEKGWASRRAEHRGWYNLNIWRGPGGLRMMQLSRQSLCEECLANGMVVPATDIDHIEPHKGVWERFVDSENLRSLCKSHHSAKTMREDMR